GAAGNPGVGRHRRRAPLPGPRRALVRDVAGDAHGGQGRGRGRGRRGGVRSASRARGCELAVARGGLGRARLLGSACELLDAALGGVELRLTEGVELLAPFPQLKRLIERRLAPFEPLHDLLELGLRLFERRLRGLGHCLTFSTRAAKPPLATVTSTCAPAETAEDEATTSPESVRTIAYPRSSVFTGDNATSFAALFSSAARFRSTASAGACRSRSRVCSSRWPSRSRATRGRARSRSTERVSRCRSRSSERRTLRASAPRARSSLPNNSVNSG